MGSIISGKKSKPRPPPAPPASLGPSPADIAAKKAMEDAAIKKQEDEQAELDRKARGRAATLLTGSGGLLDEPRISRRLLGV